MFDVFLDAVGDELLGVLEESVKGDVAYAHCDVHACVCHSRIGYCGVGFGGEVYSKESLV